jgi:hypothetical protein
MSGDRPPLREPVITTCLGITHCGESLLRHDQIDEMAAVRHRDRRVRGLRLADTVAVTVE